MPGMNKAFTCEMGLAGKPRSGGSQNDAADDELESSVQLPPGVKNYITPNGYRKLKKELEREKRMIDMELKLLKSKRER